ncbi:MAG: urease subunit gamma [Clostridiales Family XIII bacterium]|jgi:urease gamma subunit|nr:urease subunit gamma [Clostridiales Family XIII bacterium]
MKLTPKEQERLTIFTTAEIARRRWRRGVKLNYIEAAAVICDELLERARAGEESLADLIRVGSLIVTKEDVMEDAWALLPTIQLEVLLPDGNKLLTVHDPIRLERREEALDRERLLTFSV